VLPGVDDLAGLEEALKAYPVTVAVIGPEWPEGDRAGATELILSYAAGIAIAADDSVESMDTAIAAALAERSLRGDSLFFVRLLEMLPDPVFYKDRCGRFLAASRSVARHLGVDDPAVLIGRSDFDFFTPEHARQAYQDEQEIIRTGKAMDAKLEKETHEEGRTTWALTWKAPLRDHTGRVIGTYGASRDVTELKVTEGTLATDRHLLEALLTGMPDAAFIKDREGRFMLANQVLAQWRGCTPAAMRGKRDVDFHPPEVAEAFRRDDIAVMASGMPVVNREERLPTADGRELWVLTTKLPYRNSHGEIAGIIGMSRNITLRKDFDVNLQEAQGEIVALRAEVARLKAGG
jgi:two-component system sensor histidine kinase/response regulator